MSDGKELLASATKKLSSKSWFGGNTHLEEAADLYARAGNAFKLSKAYKDSGDAFNSQAETLEKMGEKDEASAAYLNASKSYKKEYPKESAGALKKAIGFLTEKGRFSAAASNQKQLAEIYEVDLADIAACMEAYELAAEWYQAEDSSAYFKVKVAQYAAIREEYDRAIDIYERVGQKSLENQLTKWSVREYYLKAGICALATKDFIKAKLSIEKYTNSDATFAQTRECALLIALTEAAEANDVEAFTTKLQEFDRMTKLDEWKTTLLLRVKKALEADDEDFT